jgi:predicted aspartyl protease
MTRHFLLSPTAPNLRDRRRIVQIDGHTIHARIYRPTLGPLDEGQSSYKFADALIDTGASDVFIDSSIAGSLGLRERNPKSVNTVRGDAGGVGYSALLVVPELDFQEHIEVIAMRIGAGKMNYPIVLGRSFLERYRIQYDGPNGTMLFEWDLPEHLLPEDDFPS